jgi:hypothetical protein
MVDQIFANWNRLASWFGLVEALKKAASFTESTL